MRGRAINRRLQRVITLRTGPNGEGQGAGGGGGQQQNNQQGGQNTGTGQGGQGSGGGGDGGDPFAGLFDDIDLSGQNGGQQGGGQGSGQQGGQGAPPNGDWVSRQEMNSEIDRRVNQVVQTLNRRYQQGRQQQGNQGGGQQGGQNGGQQHGQQGQQGQHDHAPATDPGAVREARMAFREYLNDEFKPISPVEREFAVNIGTAVLGSRDLVDADPDQVGRDVAKQTAQAMLAARKAVRDATIAQLRKAGAFTQEFLNKTNQGGGQQAAGAGSAGATTFLPPQQGAEGWAKGASAAAKFNQQLGWQKPAANTGS